MSAESHPNIRNLFDKVSQHKANVLLAAIVGLSLAGNYLQRDRLLYAAASGICIASYFTAKAKSELEYGEYEIGFSKVGPCNEVIRSLDVSQPPPSHGAMWNVVTHPYQALTETFCFAPDEYFGEEKLTPDPCGPDYKFWPFER